MIKPIELRLLSCEKLKPLERTTIAIARTVSNFKVQSLVVAEYQDGTFKSFNRKLLPRFTKNLVKTYQSLIPFDENIVRIYIYLKGTYKDLSETKTYKLDDLYYYDCESETTYGKLDNQRPKIISLMQELNKN